MSQIALPPLPARVRPSHRSDARSKPASRKVNWPKKHDLFGVKVSDTDYAQAEDLIINAAHDRVSAIVTHLPVHGLVTAATDASYRAHINSFDIVAPDGQPVRWAMNRFNATQLQDRCYGPELMIRLCRRAAREGISIYLYGSTPQVAQQLKEKLETMCPGLVVAGCESPPFRKLTAQEITEAIERINASGAGLVFIGLGCPRQDIFACENRDRIQAIQMCVGAAFDFHAGNKKMAPPWMQRRGLEWLFRLFQEPGRLWKRYLVTNTIFILLAAKRMVSRRPAES